MEQPRKVTFAFTNHRFLVCVSGWFCGVSYVYQVLDKRRAFVDYFNVNMTYRESFRIPATIC